MANNDVWNKDYMQIVLEQMVDKCAEVHSKAGHDVIKKVGAGISCDCGMVISLGMYYDNLFGWIFTVAVQGRGRPFRATDTDSIRDIVWGTHPIFGIKEKVDAMIRHGGCCPNCGK